MDSVGGCGRICSVGRRIIVLGSLVLAFLFAADARADVGVYPVTRVVPVGGVVDGWGDGSGMAVYLVPASVGPKRRACGGNGICEPTLTRPPRRPFVLLGRLRKTRNVYARQAFSFPVPPDLSPGAYRMYLYCRPCGGSLIQSGQRLEGETIRLTARPASRRIGVGAGATGTRFLVSEPVGVVLLLRLTVPHGTRASVTGSIPGLAGVMIATGRTETCNRHGSVDVCTQPEEWCPVPAAAWRFRLNKLAGPAGQIRLDFVVGQPPNGWLPRASAPNRVRSRQRAEGASPGRNSWCCLPESRAVGLVAVFANAARPTRYPTVSSSG
jgi:hypothetical protein